MMRTANYIFEHAGDTIQGVMSGNRACTDSINALEKWIVAADGRRY
ncbi:hypothetical protein [Caballeronia mineralivorans]|nr:hypothetical protein [Caballeronia mineralivorans]